MSYLEGKKMSLFLVAILVLNLTIYTKGHCGRFCKYKDMKSAFDTMLPRDISVPLHIRNLQFLMTEVFKKKIESQS